MTEIASRSQKRLGDLETPMTVYQRIYDQSEYSVLLESAPQAGRRGRFSVVASDPLASLTLYGDSLIVSDSEGSKTYSPGRFFDVLRDYLGNVRIEGAPDLPSVGCLTGYFGYDLVRLVENLPQPEGWKGTAPWASLHLFSRYVVFDHPRHSMTMIGLHPDPETASEMVLETEDLLSVRPSTRRPGPVPLDMEGPDMEAYSRMVEEAKEYVRAGEVYQLVLSDEYRVKVDVDPLLVYRHLRAASPSPHMFCLKTPEMVLLGSSPETLVRVSDGTVHLTPIAGTRGRSDDPEKDEKLARELLASEKERAEHVMLVDLARNDAGRVSEFGSVETEPYMELRRYSHVMHLVSGVRGRLRPEMDSVEALRASFPAGTVTGAPKVRAMELIDAMESAPRGPYAGAVGYIGSRGELDTCIAIRIAQYRDREYTVRVGAGIVADSVGGHECREIENKAAQTLQALRRAAGGTG
jgi:anthranilate synthase component 1